MIKVVQVTGSNDAEELYFLATHDDPRFTETLTVLRSAGLDLLAEITALRSRVETKHANFLISEQAAQAALGN